MFLTFGTRAFFMSKKQLLDFLENLNDRELKEQLIDLYGRFKNVKEFYDFSFNPNEDKRIIDAKKRINKEYFPEAGKKVKKRRSVAQKLILHLRKLELAPTLIADLMLYNLEIAQLYNAEHPTTQGTFYRSMLSSFKQAVEYIEKEYLEQEFNHRVEGILKATLDQKWPNREEFLLTRGKVN